MPPGLKSTCHRGGPAWPCVAWTSLSSLTRLSLPPTSAPATLPLTALSRAVSLATQAVFLCPEPSFLPLPWFLLYVLGAPYSILEAAVINDPRLGGLKQQKPILLQVPRPEAQCHGDGGLVPPSWTL